MIVTDDLVTFRSTHEALTFAYSVSHQAYDRPIMNRLCDGPKSNRSGIGGLEAAGQAGMIRAEVMQLDLAQQAVVAARFAPRSLPCHCRHACCSGYKPSAEWTEAIDFLTEYVLRNVLSGCVSHYRLRRGLVMRVFGSKHSLLELAEAVGVTRDLAGDHNGRVSKHLLAVEARASRALDERFKLLGLIESA